MKKNLIIKRILFVALFTLAMAAIVNIHVEATGYTYDHKGNVIYSTEGFTVNQTPYIYETLGIEASSFTDENPTDLFVYSAKNMGGADANYDTLVYMLDSGGTNNSSTIYVFDENLKLQRQVSSLWYNPATLKANGTDLSMIKSSKTLVVKSSVAPTYYTVTFIDTLAESEAEQVLGTVQVKSGDAATAAFPANHDGYYFNGWDTDFSVVTSDLTVKAQYVNIADAQAEIDAARLENPTKTYDDVETVTVTFVDGVNKKELGELVIKKGGTVEFPTVKTKAGYEFTGWTKTSTDVFKADTEVTAEYSKVHTVTFVDGQDSKEITKVEVLDGGSATAPFVPYHENLVFTGWDTSFDNVTANLTVTAQYADPTTYETPATAITVTFVDGLSGEEIAKFNVVSGEDTEFPEATSYDAYTFSGWSSDGKAITEATTITANYSKKTNGLASEESLLAENKMTLYMAGANSIYRGVSSNTTPHTDYLYVCDTSNNQILIIDATSYEETEPGKGTYEIKQIITSPVSEIGSSTFSPLKVVNDAAGRVYTICEGIEDGILEFSKTGSFDRYVGTNYVTLSAWEIFTRNFATEAQLDQFTSYQNTTFTSMVYKNNMIYTTSYSITNSNGTTNDNIMIKKINPSGTDVLRRNGYNKPKGDLKYTAYNDDNGAYGTSQFVGITVNEYGVYTVVDNKRGRLFTYDNEGNLLYISGGSGTQLDKINIPIAVQYLGDNILVLDSKRKAIIVFEPTDIAKVINKAIEYEYNGESDLAYEYWEQVIQLNANYEYAYVGIGKHYMEATDIEDNYKIAMENFELGANQVYYSKAYKQYRDARIKKWFPWVAGGLIAVCVGGAIFKKVRRKKLGIKEEEMTGMGDE